MRRSSSRWGSGYSLPELTVVVGIVALLTGMATVGLLRHRQTAEDERMKAELTSIYKAMEAHRVIYGRYPRNYQELSRFISIPNFEGRYEIR